MCGLSGFLQPGGFDASAAQASVRCMADALRHRGPDDAGVWVDAAVGVEELPAVIDLERYPKACVAKASLADGLPRVVWIGSPSTVHYLQQIAEPLQALAARRPFVLRVIGGGAIDLPGVQVEVLAWTEATEVASIQAADVGVMPLKDTPWEQGKCGYKLIQYMACGLPVVGSAVGANHDIVVHGTTGFLANTPQDWLAGLETLLTDAALRQHMGRACRARVEDFYCIQQTGPRMVDLLKKAASRNQ